MASSLREEVANLDSRQMALKIQINGFYGATASPYFRLFDPRIAEGVTLTSAIIIRYLAYRNDLMLNQKVGTKGFPYVIYSDTDSNYLNLGPIVEKYMKGKPNDAKLDFLGKIEKVVQDDINSALGHIAKVLNCPVSAMAMKRENIAESAIWTSKKRYILRVLDSKGKRLPKPKLKVTGLEIKRSTTPAAVKPMMEKVIDLCLTGTQAQVADYIASCRDVFEKMPVESIAISMGVNNTDKYLGGDDGDEIVKGTPYNSRAALAYNRLLQERELGELYQPIGNSTKIKVVYLVTPNPSGEKLIAFTKKLPPEFGLDKYVDRDTMFEKVFINPCEIILSAIGWTAAPEVGFDL